MSFNTVKLAYLKQNDFGVPIYDTWNKPLQSPLLKFRILADPLWPNGELIPTKEGVVIVVLLHGHFPLVFGQPSACGPLYNTAEVSSIIEHTSSSLFSFLI